MKRRTAIKAAIGSVAAAIWPWKTQAAQYVRFRKPLGLVDLPTVAMTPKRLPLYRKFPIYIDTDFEQVDVGHMTFEPGELLRLPNGNYWRSVICTGFTKGGKHYKLPEHERLYCEMRVNCESLRKVIRESDAWELQYMEAAQPRRDGTRWTKEDLLMMPRGS